MSGQQPGPRRRVRTRKHRDPEPTPPAESAAPAEPTPPAEPAPPAEPTSAAVRTGRRGGRRSADRAERGLRGLVGAGPTQLGVSAAMRARDASRPTAEDLAAAERDLVIVRRNYTAPGDTAAEDDRNGQAGPGPTGSGTSPDSS